MALFIDGVPGMPEESGLRKAGSRWVRVDGAVRLIDTPNSRIGLEVDLDLLPWDPFDALGKKVTLLLPQDHSENGSGDEDPENLKQALRYVDHAAGRCREFAEAGNGDTSDWWKAYRTWDWLRKRLSGEWGEETAESAAASSASERVEVPAVPSLPGAATILEYTLGALRTIPLSHWEETVATLDPEAPSREEAIRTVQILSGLLRRPSENLGEPSVMEEPEASVGKVKGEQEIESGTTESASQLPPTEPQPKVRRPDLTPDETADPEDMSFEYAHGFDEGYQMGRRVGFAMGNHARKRGRRLPDQS